LSFPFLLLGQGSHSFRETQSWCSSSNRWKTIDQTTTVCERSCIIS